ncbi:tetratricopeptide repeat protein [Calditrichota bacterium GD2]
MRAINNLMRLVLPLILIMGFAFNGYAQDLLLEEEEQPQEENNCIPENLTTPWDSLANKPLNQDIRLVYNFGYEYFKNQSYKEALPYLWKVYLHDSSKYARAAVRKIADIYYLRGNVDSTLIICYRGLQQFPDMIRLHYYAGALQNRLGKFRCAIPHFEKLVESDSNNVNYVKTLAFLYFKADDERAVKYQERVTQLEPDNLEESERYAQYMNHFYGEGADLKIRKEAYLKDPENVDLAYKYAKVAVNSGAYEDAIEPISKVIEKKPTKAAYLLRAEAYESLNKNFKAINDYKAILKMDPKDVDIMLRISVNYRLENEFSKAEFWIKKALATKPGYGLAYITLGELYEAAVPYCQEKLKRKKTAYEDKLVYQKAYEAYKKAEKDPAFRSKARKKQEIIKPFIPTQEDVFMHKNDKIHSPCYQWIID